MKTDRSETPDAARLRALPPEARFSLRAREAHLDRLGEVLGLALPRRIGSRAAGGGGEALCLGPDEWRIVFPEARKAETVRAMAAAYDEAPHAFADISDREISYVLEGPGACEIVAMGCPRDLRAIAPGRATRTIFDGATVILWRDGPEAFRIDVWRSFAPHLAALVEIGRTELRAGL